MPFRKNVFIVGAGFSAEGGAPVIRTFFDRAMEICKDPHSPLEHEERKVFRSVFDYRRSLDIAEHQVRADFDNIEDLFGAVEMAAQLGKADSENVRKSLVYVILRTIEITTAATSARRGVTYYFKDGNNQRSTAAADDAYEFSIKLIARRWFPLPAGQSIARDSIISLNYDLLIERVLEESPLAAVYDLPVDSLLSAKAYQCKLRLLKLHGSANWIVCSSCRDRVYVVPYAGAGLVQSENQLKCESCGNQATTRLIVPPTWNKEEYRTLLNPVWQSAVRELESAQRIFVIGYSMPETDKFFNYLLALSLAENKELDEVIVVNNNTGDARRIAELFRRLHERGRIHLQTMEFGEWVRRDFQRQIHQMPFPSQNPAW